MRFLSPRRAALEELTDEEWKHALSFCDSAHLTLPLGLECRSYVPEWVAQRVDGNLANNAERWRRVQEVYGEASRAFHSENLGFAVLKGFSHCPQFVPDAAHRPHGDLDLYFPEEQVFRAREAAIRLGYEPLPGFDDLPIDHLPAMIRKTGWEWRGDYFDPQQPCSLELHFRFWDQRTERFAPLGLEQFWERRQSRVTGHLEFASLHPVDAAGYAALHLLRHLLRGDVRPYHVYELAAMLHRSAHDENFWQTWCQWHDVSLRRLEAICFELARRWFDCRMPEAAADQVSELPAEVARWLETRCESPLEARFQPNKDELWLHWALLESEVQSRRARFAVLRRRLLPGRIPQAFDAVFVPDAQVTPQIRRRRRWRNLSFAASRGWYHMRALPAAAVGAIRWFGAGIGLETSYWKFFLAAGLYNLGLYIFFLLYNLYLLKLGFRENVVGLISSAMTAGSVAGCLPVAFAIRRFGVRKTLLVCFALIAVVCALRASVTPAPLLIGLAFLAGIVSSSWAVCISPAVAQLTSERNRAFGFSLIFSAGIGIGILGGAAGGGLPGIVSRLHLASSAVGSYRAALLTGCALVMLALWPLSRIRIQAAALPAEQRLYPSRSAILPFLVAMAVWNAGTGLFNPFFNVFFARLRVPVEKIGLLYSAAHLAQAGMMLLAPLVLKRFGLTRGVSGMQLATALAMFCLAGAQGPAWAGLAFAMFTASQYMSEPGLSTYLMGSVPAAERGGASALNFLVVFSMQAGAAALSGWLLTRVGYAPVLVAGSFICATAALLFRVLLEEPKPHPASVS